MVSNSIVGIACPRLMSLVESSAWGTTARGGTDELEFEVWYCVKRCQVQAILMEYSWFLQEYRTGFYMNFQGIKMILDVDMCQDPNHLFLWFQILTKIMNIHRLFMLKLMAFISPFHVRFNSVFARPKFREKCPRSWRFCGSLDPRSVSVFGDFHGIRIISSKKSLVI